MEWTVRIGCWAKLQNFPSWWGRYFWLHYFTMQYILFNNPNLQSAIKYKTFCVICSKSLSEGCSSLSAEVVDRYTSDTLGTEYGSVHHVLQCAKVTTWRRRPFKYYQLSFRFRKCSSYVRCWKIYSRKGSKSWLYAFWNGQWIATTRITSRYALHFYPNHTNSKSWSYSQV